MTEIFSQTQQYFDSLWQSEGNKLFNGDITPALMKEGATDPVDYCVSTVARLSQQQNGNETIKALQSRIIDLFSVADTQFVYPSESLHISLVGCTQRESQPTIFTQEHIQNIDSVCEKVIINKNPADIILKGIGIIGNQIFIQGYDQNRNWEQLRTTLTSGLEYAGEQPISYPDKSRIHMNILRIVDNSSEKLKQIHDKIKEFREINFGIVNFDTVELVITDFVLSKNNFTSLKKYKLKNIEENEK